MESLPPNKRFRLMTHHQQQQQSHLPAKKRKPSSSFSLPAKKRVWALPPLFDLDDDLPAKKRKPSSSFSLPAKKRVLALPPLFDLDDDLPAKKRKPSSSFSLPAKKRVSAHSPLFDLNDDDDDGIVCAVCQSTDGEPSDPIVVCEGCELMVHASCYGAPLVHSVPDGDWFCLRCSSSAAADSISCCLCPNPGGALKPLAPGDRDLPSGRWAHVVCALLVPEVYFDDPVARQGINCSTVPAARWNRRCYVCEGLAGCVVDCSEPKCGLAFHVTCGLREDLCFEYLKGKNTKSDVVAAFCNTHTHLWRKQEATGKFKIVAREE